jgi:hypothetical protein
MEKKLYRVKVVLFVMAENESNACVAATQARFDIFGCAAKKAEFVNPGWGNAIPYNADDERTCSEIMTNVQQTAHPEARSEKLPTYVEAGIRAFEVDNRYNPARTTNLILSDKQKPSFSGDGNRHTLSGKPVLFAQIQLLRY